MGSIRCGKYRLQQQGSVKKIRITRKQKVNTGSGSLWYVFCFQFASLYNPVDKRVKERVMKMLLLGVTQRSEMRRHLNVFVAENFPDVSELDSSFFPSDRALSSLMYRSMILHRQTHIDQERVLRLVRFKWE